jgi:hypothetical protein
MGRKAFASGNKNYISNKELTYELIVSVSSGKLTRKAEYMIYLIIKNVSRKFRYKNEDDRADCEAEAAYQIFKNWHNFNVDINNNAFAFVTEIIKRGYAQGFNRIYKKDYITGEYIDIIPFSVLFRDSSSGIIKINI